MSLTNEQKEQKREYVSKMADKVLEKLSINGSDEYQNTLRDFYKGIRCRNFKNVLELNTTLTTMEENAIDSVVFPKEEDDVSSTLRENVCGLSKSSNQIRQLILELAMDVDADVGYWIEH